MTTVFLICAVAGGTLFVCQLVMMLTGMGGHHDLTSDTLPDYGGDAVAHAEAHEAAHALWGMLSLRALVAAVTIFGLTGLAAQEASVARPLQLLIAAASGLVAASGVSWLMRMVLRLQSDGTAHIEGARGATGTVYVSIPASGAGPGKVQLELQNRTVELKAVTPKAALETGTKIVVVDIVNPETVEVIAVPERSRA